MEVILIRAAGTMMAPLKAHKRRYPLLTQSGKALIDAIIREAVRIGYSEMRLDTLPNMATAIFLYKKAGFVPIEPYYETPIPGTLFLARPLVV